MKLKIGQEITISEDFEIKGSFSEDIIQIKKGDKGFIDRGGFVHYKTGKARGKMQRFLDVELEDYDTENIASLIFEHIKWKFGMGEFLEDYEIEDKDVIEEIDCVLDEIF